MNFQGLVPDRTYRDACLLERVGEHDHYEPTQLERVYVLLDHEACQVKIGWTRHSVHQRKRAAELDRGRTLELIGTFSGSRHLERALHQRFRSYRCEKREWFSSEILADLIPLLAAE